MTRDTALDLLAERRAELERRLAALSPEQRAGIAVAASAAPTPERIIPPRRPGAPVPMSFAQELLWLLERTSTGGAYNVPRMVRLSGALDVVALQLALDALVDRHEVLRTTFGVGRDQPQQIVHPPRSVALHRIDLSELQEGDRLAEARRRARELARLPFDLENDPQLRAAVIRLAPDDHVLVLVSHHIASDGWSGNIMMRELAALYDGFGSGTPTELPAVPLQYADYATWQRRVLSGEHLAALLAYWRTQLDGAATLLDLPTDRLRPATPNFEGARCATTLPLRVLEGLRQLAREHHATDFMVILAALNVLLFRYTGEEEIVVGSPVAGRTLPELDGVVGFFTNTLLLRTSLAGNPTFHELLDRVRARCLDAYDHQEIPLELLLLDRGHDDRPLAVTPQVVLATEDPERETFHLPGTTSTPFGAALGTTKFDLMFWAAERPQGLRIVAEFRTDLFDAATVDRLLRHYRTLLEAVVVTPDVPVTELPIIDAAERDQVVVEWNDTAAGYPVLDTLHSLVEAQARRRPDTLAVECLDGGVRTALTYGELDRRANRVACTLRDAGVRPDVLVAVCLERSVDTVVAILGVLKAGGAYLPLDSSYPDDRLDFTVRDAGAMLLLTDGMHRARLEGLALGVPLLEVDHAVREGAADTAPQVAVLPHHLAYVIYTSGSTGRPKGVMVEHRNVTRLLVNDRFPFHFDERDVWTVFHSFAFDFSVWELFGALVYGGRAVVVPRAVAQSPGDFLTLLEATGTTILNQVPSAFYALMNEALRRRPRLALRYVIFGGEALKPALLRAWHAAWPSIRLVNMFGITETTVHVTYKEIGDAEIIAGASNIGRPIPTLTLHVLDAQLRPVPPGVRGEICVGGLGVARGYLNRPDLTAERFIPDPFGGGGRLYRSGDLGRRLPNGEIEYLGRRDHQVKIRGHRIELGEIEGALLQEPGVIEAVVIVREDLPGDPQLTAYVVVAGDSAASPSTLREHLRRRLPTVMVPAAVMCLGRLPLTSNGKVDRKALPAPPREARDLTDYKAPRTPLEGEISDMWASLLGVDRVGVNDDFFDLGGHSLLAMRMITDIERIWGRRLPLQSLFERPTVAEVVALIVSSLRQDEELGVPVIQRDGPGTPLAFVHGDILGSGWYCRRLAPLLGDAPLIVLPTLSWDSPGNPVTIEAMAGVHVRALKNVQSNGPYRLGGFCNGGLIAYEMARQLVAQGEEVEALVLVDSVCPSARFRALWPLTRLLTRPPTTEQRLDRRARFNHRIQYYTMRLRQARRMSTVDRLRWSVQFLRRMIGLGRRSSSSPADSVAGARRATTRRTTHGAPAVGLGATAYFMSRAQRGYMPGRYAGRVDVIRASRAIAGRPWFIRGGGWQHIAADLHLHAIEGEHDRMVMPDGLPDLAKQMRACLNRDPER